jgi:hypothetical protein
MLIAVISMISKCLIAAATLATVAIPALADEVELYCEGRHNDGAGAPVLKTNLWLKINVSGGHHTIELQGPVFEKDILVVEEFPTELRATHFNDEEIIEQKIVLNRQNLSIYYSVRTSPEVDHVFLGTCGRYSPKI